MDSSKSSKSTKSVKSTKSTKSTKSPNSTHLFAKYGKTCRHKASSKSSSDSDSEKAKEIDDSKVENNEEKRVSDDGENDANDEGADEETGKEYRKSSSKQNLDDIDLAGAGRSGADSEEEEEDDEDNEDHAIKGSDEKYASHENEEGEAGVDGDDEAATGGDDESKEPGEEGQDDTYEDTEMAGEDTAADELYKGKKRKTVKPVMEYDVQDMYPEINILIQKKKREWDFQDPDIIRALWLETKTLALAEWKVRNAKIKIDKPSLEARDNMTANLRLEFLKHKAELQQALEERNFEMTEASRDPPHFDAIQLATNLTTDMRYKYNRNNPPVPSHYIEHFEKFKKPPFKNNPNSFSCKNC
ncbi:nucleolin-like [Planococcus citri]|uniref:nucleolin-like n=1 Tax=Planococcus citri TaxID=170843 RepID=UPI0031F933A1